MSMEREEMHRLIDQLPEDELKVARRYLEYLRDVDPVRKALDAASVDDEAETEEEREAVKQGEDDISAGRTLTTDELKRELGL